MSNHQPGLPSVLTSMTLHAAVVIILCSAMVMAQEKIIHQEHMHSKGAASNAITGTCSGFLGDLDSDGDIDRDDWPLLESVLSGPGGSVAGGFECADFDSDSDVDLIDTFGFCRAFTGTLLRSPQSIALVGKPEENVRRILNQSGINISVQTGGQNTVTVSPGEVIAYSVIGELGDSFNEGLAGFSLNLHFSGGDLAASQVDTPAGVPMSGFVKPEGTTNPAGFGGTVIGGDLVQIGGHQNTINNTPEYASFPIGTVITGLGQSPLTIVTGTLAAPMTPGTYQLQAVNVAASVIKDGETGVPFWATEAAAVGNIMNLTINVSLEPIPAISTWGIAIMVILIGVASSIVLRQRNAA